MILEPGVKHHKLKETLNRLVRVCHVNVGLIISLLPLGEGPGKRGVAEAARCSSPLPNPLPKGEGARTNYRSQTEVCVTIGSHPIYNCLMYLAANGHRDLAPSEIGHRFFREERANGPIDSLGHHICSSTMGCFRELCQSLNLRLPFQASVQSHDRGSSSIRLRYRPWHPQRLATSLGARAATA